MKSIYIGFSKPKKFMPIYSWIIRLVEGTPFSHVYVRSSTKYGVGLIYQASGTSVNFQSEVYFYHKAEVINEFEFEVSDQAFDAYMRFALLRVGAPYGIMQAIGIGLSSLLGFDENPFGSGRSKYVCSELVGEILYEIGRFKYDRVMFDRLTPKDIFKFCQSRAEQGVIK